MTVHGGEALEVALALLRAPGLRTALRDRPLPGDVGDVLAIAAGSADAARRAAARTGYPEAELVEAARFYVQQVLLTEGADAYRILGAARSAGHATLRHHHRLLLRWLHPDRGGLQWDSALAARVNQAWNRLRTREARARYDATLDAHATAAAVTAPSRSAPRRRVSEPRAGAARPHPTAPIAVTALGVACAALAWLAIRREDAPDIRPAASAPERSTPALAAPDAAPTAAPPPTLATVRGRPAPAPDAAPAAAMSADPAAAISASSASGVSRPVEPGITPAVVVAQTSTEEPMPMPARPAGSASSGQPSRSQPHSPPPSPMPAAAQAPAQAAATPSSTSAEIPLALEAGSVPATAGGAPAAAAPASIAPTRDPDADDDPLRLLREAEATVLAVTTYLAAPDGPPPAWQDEPARRASADVRNRLHARNGQPRQPRLILASPNWTLGGRAASMRASYRLDDRRGRLETGVLRVQLARRDRQWRVVSLHLEPTP